MAETSPRISVVIPHYNDLERLDRCLSALDAQTVPRGEFEVIVSDNGTPAGEDAVRQVINGRARLVSAPIRGAGPARNSGVEGASAPILAFTDSDCLPDPQWLEQGVAKMAEADLIGGRMVVTRETTGPMSGAEAFEAIFAFNNKTYVEQKAFTVTANLFCLRSTFDAVGPFRTELSEDMEWCLRARDKGFRIAYAEKAVVGHPARRDWEQLRRKWVRMNREAYAMARAQGGTDIGWLLKSWILFPSIPVHMVRVLRSREISGVHDKAAALGTLVRLRLWRFIDRHRCIGGKGE